MAIDGITIYAMAKELNQVLEHCKIEKVNQPTKDEIVLTVRKKGFNQKLLINTSSNNPRVHFLKENRENPKTPPMFCMLLRKHLAGAIITNVETFDFERLMKIEVLAYDEMGVQAKKYLIIELMGKFSNLILMQNDKLIIDCAKRVDFESSIRPLLPNIFYEYPPKQEKISILDINDDFIDNVKDADDIVKSIKGICPVTAKTLFEDGDFRENILNFKDYVEKSDFKSYILYKDGKVADFSIIKIKGFESLECDNFSGTLCDFYEQKDKTNALKSVHKELSKTVKNLITRQKKKIIVQNEELEQTKTRDTLKVYGDLIVSNLYAITNEKSESIKLINYFDENMSEIEIPLDIKLSPKQNADKYFLKYNKFKNAEKILIQELKKGEINLVYLESVLESIERTENTAELLEIKAELVQAGFVKKSSKTSKKPILSLPNKYISKEGYTIYSGKNNTQNDTLTMKTASKNDLWFHTQNIHGSHVILLSNGQQVDDETILECAMIAVQNSKAKNSQNVPVDYCKIANVKKPKGAKAGMVIFENYNTIYATPNAQRIEEMKINDNI